MGAPENTAAQSVEALTLWHELWERMVRSEAEVVRLKVANRRLHEEIALARANRRQ